MIKNDNAIIFQAVKPNQCCDTCMLMFPALTVTAELCKREFSGAGLTTVASYTCLAGLPPSLSLII